jgi:hypothetical protein
VVSRGWGHFEKPLWSAIALMGRFFLYDVLRGTGMLAGKIAKVDKGVWCALCQWATLSFSRPSGNDRAGGSTALPLYTELKTENIHETEHP